MKIIKTRKYCKIKKIFGKSFRKFEKIIKTFNAKLVKKLF